jgi:hypothetical protein
MYEFKVVPSPDDQNASLHCPLSPLARRVRMLEYALDGFTARLGHYVALQQDQFVSAARRYASRSSQFVKRSPGTGAGKLVLLDARGQTMSAGRRLQL